MGQRQQSRHSKVGGVRFVPHSYDSSSCFINIKTDYAPFFFTHVVYKPTEHRKTGSRFGILTALFLGVFLSHFLLECMDVESNPGPLFGNRGHFHTHTWSDSRAHRDESSWNPYAAHDSQTARAPASKHGIGTLPNNERTRDYEEQIANTRNVHVTSPRGIMNTLQHATGGRSRGFDELDNDVCSLSRSVTDLHTNNDTLVEEVTKLSNVQKTQQQELSNHKHYLDGNFAALYDWCRSLQMQNSIMETEMSRISHCIKNQSQHPLQPQEVPDAATPGAISDVLNWCQSIQEENDTLRKDVKCLSSRCEALEEQNSHLIGWSGDLTAKYTTADQKLEKLEASSRASNLKFFNVFEETNENSSDCVRQVVQLLNRFFPVKTWSTEDVDKSYRLGSRNASASPRPIIATMHRWKDKILVLREHECRSEMADCVNIRVATDLTDRQNVILREQKQSGNQAYFYKGRLHHHSQDESRGPTHRLHYNHRRVHQHAPDRQFSRPNRESVAGDARTREQDRSTVSWMMSTSSEANGNYLHGGHQTRSDRQDWRQQTTCEQDIPHPEDTRPMEDEQGRHPKKSGEHRSRQSMGDAEPAFVSSQAQHAHSTPPQNDTESHHQHQVFQTDVRVPAYYSVSDFPTLRREPTRTTPAKTPTKRKTARRQGDSTPRPIDQHAPRPTAITTTHEDDIMPNISLTVSTTLTTGLDTGLKSPQDVTDVTMATDLNSSSRLAADRDGSQQPSGDVLTEKSTTRTPEPEHDLSQTFAKQLLDPWETPEDTNSETPSSPGGQAQDNLPEDGVMAATHLTFEDDPESTPEGPLTRSKARDSRPEDHTTPVTDQNSGVNPESTPVDGPLTRSKVHNKQTHLTDIFPSSGARSSRRASHATRTDSSPI